MQAKITQSLVQNITPQQKVFKVNDVLLKGFTLIVRPSGKKTLVVDYRKPDGTRTDYKIGPVTLITVLEAREEARNFLAAVNRGEDPAAPTIQPDAVPTLGDFMNSKYAPWVIANRKNGQKTVQAINNVFKSFLEQPLEQITAAKLEEWRTLRKQERGIKAATLNRDISALRASINWAVRMDIIKENPMSKLKDLPERDSKKIVRYFSTEERSRFMAALDERDKEMRQEREMHNEWRKERNLPELPPLGYFTDHLRPMILLALSTGIRQGTLFGLEWGDVNFPERTLTLRAEIEKTDKTRFMLMNDTAYNVLSKWKEQSGEIAPQKYIFQSPITGRKFHSCKNAWANLMKRADIKNFRWHDMRHDFASQLVMSGVDLNTVRDLLGHADLTMTLRYAHLAPENKLRAVNVLDKIILPVTPVTMEETAC